MKELKDIVLKKGDVIYFDNGSIMLVEWCEGINSSGLNHDHKIIKIERPVKYETIYETPKQILDKEEKEYLEAVCRLFKEKFKILEQENKQLKKQLAILNDVLDDVCDGYVRCDVYGTEIWEDAQKLGGVKNYFIQQKINESSKKNRRKH